MKKARRYYLEHREDIIAKNTEYYKNHKDKISKYQKEYNKLYYILNKDKIVAKRNSRPKPVKPPKIPKEPMTRIRSLVQEKQKAVQEQIKELSLELTKPEEPKVQATILYGNFIVGFD